MKRLGTTPKRRPTVACAPTIGHRTPKKPVKPCFDDTGEDYLIKWFETSWTKNKALDQGYAPPPR